MVEEILQTEPDELEELDAILKEVSRQQSEKERRARNARIQREHLQEAERHLRIAQKTGETRDPDLANPEAEEARENISLALAAAGLAEAKLEEDAEKLQERYEELRGKRDEFAEVVRHEDRVRQVFKTVEQGDAEGGSG